MTNGNGNDPSKADDDIVDRLLKYIYYFRPTNAPDAPYVVAQCPADGAAEIVRLRQEIQMLTTFPAECLRGAKSLVLYFATVEDRQDFVDAWKTEHPAGVAVPVEELGVADEIKGDNDNGG